MNFRRELVLVNKRIRCRDVFPADGLFFDVAKALWRKYKDTLTDHGEENVDNLIAEQDRMPLRFHYVDASGSQCLIEPSESVGTILDQGATQVIWDHVPVGGDLNFRQVFSQHASEILALPEFAHWKCIFGSSPKYGIVVTSPEKNGQVRTLKITPSGDYPTTPPTVIAEPGFPDDPCWSDGILDFAYLSEKGRFAWEKRVTDKPRNKNPLQELVAEVLQDYGLDKSPIHGKTSGEQDATEDKPKEKAVSEDKPKGKTVSEDSSPDTPQPEQRDPSIATSSKRAQQKDAAKSKSTAKAKKTTKTKKAVQSRAPKKTRKTDKRADESVANDKLPLLASVLADEAKKLADQTDDTKPLSKDTGQISVADTVAAISKKPLAIVIPNQVAKNCLEQWQAAVRSKGKFIEQGGAIIGSFDGSRIFVSDLLHDKEATATAAYIRLSFQVLDDAEQIAAERARKSNVPHYYVGTWHVHPPGFGNQLSHTDRTRLFQERMLIKSDEPFAEFPMGHLIFDGKTLSPRAYSMVVKANFSRQQLSHEDLQFELGEIVRHHADLGEDIGGLTATSSGWEAIPYYNMGSMSGRPIPKDFRLGFWKIYPYTKIPSTFEEVFLENFYRKVRVPRFLYCQYLAKRKRRDRFKGYLVERKGTVDLDAEAVDFVPIGIEYTSNRKR
jgi:hypothetical protein